MPPLSAKPLIDALQAALPPEQRSQSFALATALLAAAEGDASLLHDPQLTHGFAALAGRQLQVGGASIHFGDGEHRGEIRIDDLVGGDKFGGDKVGGDKNIIFHVTLPAAASDAKPAFQVPYRSNPLFRGRDAELAELAAVLLSAEGGTAAVTPAIAGIGGIGKTQLAAEFAHRYRGDFPGGVFWLAMEQAESVATQVAACSGPDGLNLAGWKALSFEERIAAVRRAWNEPIRRLLVFDNVEDPAVVEEWRPHGQQARVLITTRRGVWTAHQGVQPIRLRTLARAESVRLLLAPRAQAEGCSIEALLADPAEAAAADAICEQVGDLPLALALAGAYLEAEPGVSLPEYLSELGREDIAHASLETSLLARLPTHHVTSVTATIALSYSKLDPTLELDAQALRLLQRAAVLAPAPLPPRLLARLVSEDIQEPTDARATQAAVRRLALLGLVETIPGQEATIHRLVAAFARTRTEEGEAVDEVVLAGLAQELDAVVKAGYPLAGLPLIPHALVVAERTMSEGTEISSFFLDKLAILLQRQGNFAGARQLFERALEIDEQIKGPTHPDTGAALNNLAGLLRDQGDFAGARPLLERALTIQEQELGPDHLTTALTLNGLGTVLREQGDFAGARQLFERALTIQEQELGPDHLTTAATLSILGTALRDQGDFAGARQLLERALTIQEQELGPDHLTTAATVNSLGMVLRDQGDFAGARQLLERALTIQEQELGPTHPHTALCLSNLGIVLRHQGDLTGARQLFERALTIQEQELGPTHPHIATNFSNLGMVLRDQGDFVGARPLMERALAIQERELGPLHPSLAMTLNNLSAVLREQGDLVGARQLFERALAIQEQELGPLHPDLATTLNNLSAVLREQGDLVGARPLMERALAIQEQELGPLHPALATTLNNLGMLLRDQGDLVRARPLMERALAIQERELGPLHPDLALCLNNLAGVLYDLGNTNAARVRLVQALNICKRVLGPNHPTTVQIRQNSEALNRRGRPRLRRR